MLGNLWILLFLWRIFEAIKDDVMLCQENVEIGGTGLPIYRVRCGALATRRLGGLAEHQAEHVDIRDVSSFSQANNRRAYKASERLDRNFHYHELLLTNTHYHIISRGVDERYKRR